MFGFKLKNPSTDAHGQPLNDSFRRAAVADRQIDEMLGIIKGVLEDGEVNHTEAVFLLNWMERNREMHRVWPVSVLYPRIYAAMADGFLDETEQSELLAMLAAPWVAMPRWRARPAYPPGFPSVIRRHRCYLKTSSFVSLENSLAGHGIGAATK